MYEGDQDVYRALAAGAVAYVLKNSHSDELIRVVRDVHEGRTIDPGAPARLARRPHQA